MKENITKEVNLLQLINLFFNWLMKIGKAILNFLGYLVQLSFRHKIIVISTILICLFYGLYLSRPSVRIYKAEAMAMIYGSEAQTVKEVCKQLENSISSNVRFSLSTKLSIPDSVARNIVGFHSFYVIDYLKDKVADVVDYDNKNSLTDTLNMRMKDRLYFQILTTNISQIPKMQKAILDYFNNVPVMKAQFVNKRGELLEEIKICNVESKLIDSLAKVSYFKDVDKQLKFENNKLLIGEQKKQLFYFELLDIQKTKVKAETSIIDFNQPMDFPSNFVVFPEPENGSFRYGIIGAIIGYLLALILSGFIENVGKIKTFLDRN